MKECPTISTAIRCMLVVLQHPVAALSRGVNQFDVHIAVFHCVVVR